MLNLERMRRARNIPHAFTSTPLAGQPGERGALSLSVVIPTYNCRFLEEAVTSAYAQTVTPGQVIVVNDGSTDDTEARLRRLASSLPASFVWHTKPNGGVSSARNVGLRQITGDFVAFLDNDDVWHPRKLERQLGHFATDPELALSFTGYEYSYRGYDPARRLVQDLLPVAHHDHWNPDPEVVLEELLFRRCPVGSLSTVLIRREALAQVTPFDERLTMSGDVRMYLEVAVRHLKMDYLPEALVQYRRHEGNLTNDIAAAIEDACQMYDGFLEEHMSELPLHIRMRAAKLRSHWHLLTAIDAIQRGEKVRARRHILIAARRRPLSIRPGWARMLGIGAPP